MGVCTGFEDRRRAHNMSRGTRAPTSSNALRVTDRAVKASRRPTPPSSQGPVQVHAQQAQTVVVPSGNRTARRSLGAVSVALLVALTGPSAVRASARQEGSCVQTTDVAFCASAGAEVASFGFTMKGMTGATVDQTVSSCLWEVLFLA